MVQFFWKSIPAFPITLICFGMIYYLVTRLNTVDLKWNKLRKLDRILLSNIMLIQFFCLIPMFTVLSCDMPRVILYWIISTLLLYHFFKHDKYIFISWLSRLSKTIQYRIDNTKFLSSPWTYLGVLFCLPISYCGGASIFGSYPVIIMYQIYSVFKYGIFI